jgi:hypothetical protein
MHLADYGVRVGGRANLVLLGTRTIKEAIRVSASRDLLIRDGKVVEPDKTER